MKTLPVKAAREEIASLVAEWTELLARKQYAEALDFILYDNTQIIDGEIWIWTPERLEAAVYTYGQPWYSKEDMKRLYGIEYPVDRKITSIMDRPDKEKWLEDIKNSIEFFDGMISVERAEMWGISKLDYKNMIGEILFDGIPIDGEQSDLTAQFWIIKINENQITLVFRDLHIM